MKKADWQYLVDTLLFICMLSIAFIGILMGFFLAEGPTVRESEKYFLGLHRHQWGDIHLYLSLAFILLIIVHLILAWNWIKGKSQSLFRKGWGAAISLTFFGGILLLFGFWIFTPKYPLSYKDYGKGARVQAQSQFLPGDFIDEEEGYLTITGRMTLAEVERITGIPTQSLIQKLGLPVKTSPDETLGQLRKKHGFSVSDIREIITTLLQSVPEELPEFPVPTEVLDETSSPMQEKVGTREEEPKFTRGRLSEDRSGILITGRMTLHDLEKQTGLSARWVIDTLGLPQHTPLDMSLGQLRRRYGFTMQEVRDTVASLLEKKSSE